MTQITVRVPKHWLEILDGLAQKGSSPGLELTRTDAARQVMAAGIDVMQKRKKGD